MKNSLLININFRNFKNFPIKAINEYSQKVHNKKYLDERNYKLSDVYSKSKTNMLVITQDKHYTELKKKNESLLMTLLLLSF